GDGRAPTHFQLADALALPFAAASFDAASAGFGVRNFGDLRRGLSEMARVVRPGGRVVVLEITTPTRAPLSHFYALWFDRLVPALGTLAARLLATRGRRGARSGGATIARAPLAKHANATIRAGGKRLRPLLVLVASESAGGPRRTPLGEQALVRAAVAVELVHSATLVHDDLIDGARLRRGRPTVAATGGRQAAVATGDLLFSLAFAQLAKNDDAEQLRALSDASSALAAGELLQREDAYAAH